MIEIPGRLKTRCALADVAFRHAHTLGRFQQEQSQKDNTVELNLVQGATASRYVSPSLSFLTTHQLETSATSETPDLAFDERWRVCYSIGTPSPSWKPTMKFLVALIAFLFAAHTLAVEPLTNAEKKRLADVETGVKRTPAGREATETFAAVRKTYEANRLKFPNDRDAAVASVYRKATNDYEAFRRNAMLAIDPTIGPLIERQAELKKLGLDKANEGETIADADSNRNLAMKPIEDVPGLPRVLIIGDSISIGYTLPLRAKLKSKANVHRIPMNGGATEVGLEHMQDWLGDKKWAVIHFNFGLHDAKYASETIQRASREEYAENLRLLIAHMKRTGAKLIFATTTPVPKNGILSPGRKFDSIEERNKIAMKVMQETEVAVDDLYAAVLPMMDKVGRANDVHFAPEGYEVLAAAVAKSIETQLMK